MSKKDKKPQVEELKDEKGQPMMHVKVYSPFKSYFDEPAYSISAVNHTGPFDILPRHHNFMTLISPCDIKIKSASEEEKIIPVNQALMHVKANIVVVFLG